MSNIAGLYIVGDLTGVPLLKFSADTGARAVRHVVADANFQRAGQQDNSDSLYLAIVGAGVSGMSVALEARQAGLSFTIAETNEPFSTLINFPKGKPIYTYPTAMEPSGHLRFRASVREALIQELKEQALTGDIQPLSVHIGHVAQKEELFKLVTAQGDPMRARRVIVAIGRSGSFRSPDVPSEQLDKVSNRLHDPNDYANQDVLVVGGGDSAVEAAIAIAQSRGRVTSSYRQSAFPRPKSANIETLYSLVENTQAVSSTGDEAQEPGTIRLFLGSQLLKIEKETVTLRNNDGHEQKLKNSAVFSMIGRQAPLDFFRRSGVAILGEMTRRQWTLAGLFMTFCFFIYNWKAGGDLTRAFENAQLFPFNAPNLLATIWPKTQNIATLPGIIAFNSGKPSFWYSLLYSALVVVFKARRIQRRRTPYIKWQTLSLIGFQIVPLFLLPYIALPYLGYNGFFDNRWAKHVADALFPEV